MNKVNLHKAITALLLQRYETAKWAAKQAYEAATNEESIAENKYDTFGLEASYLAHGQSQRVIDCEKDWILFDKKQSSIEEQGEVVVLWSVVTLAATDPSINEVKLYFVSPCAGGLKVELDDQSIYLVTPSSPVGKALLGKTIYEDVFLLQAGTESAYEIVNIQ